MNKKFFYTFAATALLALSSCSEDNTFTTTPGDSQGDNVTLSLNVTNENFNARSRYGEGTKATNLMHVVYEKTGENTWKKLFEGELIKDYTGRTNLELQLAKDKTYTVLLVAHANNPTCYVDVSSEDYAGLTLNTAYEVPYKKDMDNGDIFYATKTVTVTGNEQLNVTLTRPLAQINIGTNDFEAAEKIGVKPTVSKIKLTNAYKNYDLLKGEPAGGAVDVEIPFVEIENHAGHTYPVGNGKYQYLAVGYFIVDKSTTDVVLTYRNDVNDPSTEKVRTITNVPVQPNYQTNIYGQVLTSTIGLDIDTKPGFDNNYDYPLTWDGETVTYPTQTDDNEYTLRSASDFAGLAELVNGGKDYEGTTFVLASDFDMGGYDFDGITNGATRSGAGYTGNVFKGVFDGNGKTISNLTINHTGTDNDVAGFIGNLSGKGATVKNVTFDNVNITTNGEQAGIVGIVTEGATVEGVIVKSGTVSAKEAAGGIVGRVLKSGTVKNCENYATVTSPKNVGGIVAAAYYTEQGSEMVIDNCKNYGTVIGTGAGSGGVVGLSCATVKGCENHGEVKGATTSTGGIVGEQKSAGYVQNCTNYADITGGSGYGTGGIVGWVRYENSASYARENEIEVTGCVNEGKTITGSQGVGGIVGIWYKEGKCNGNTNKATKISATVSFVAGIVGGLQWTEASPNQTGQELSDKLEVKNNKSTTTLEQMEGGCQDLYIYDNTGAQHCEKDGNQNSL